MSVKLKKLLQQPWAYGISRNISIWHNEFNIRTAAHHHEEYQITPFLQCKVHHGTHSDFYYTETGPYGRDRLMEKLADNFKTSVYIHFLKKIYRKNGTKLIALAKRTTPTAASLQTFFDWYGYCIPMLDVTAQASKYLTTAILNLLADLPNKENIIAYYARLTNIAPIQRLERDLAAGVQAGVNADALADKLFKKYFWIPVNFVNEPWDRLYFIDRIRNFKTERRNAVVKPPEKISKAARHYIKLLHDVAALNEYRKAIFCQVNWYARRALQEVATKNGYSGWQAMSMLTADEIVDLARARPRLISPELFRSRMLCAVFNDAPGSAAFIYGNEVSVFEKKFKPTSLASEVKGIVAHRGLVRGRAVVLLDSADRDKCREGDIIIAKMTSVDFVQVMKKAGAFVTDEGGLASHAAIVAREYDKPCIVGTGVSTVIFKDGDTVEVDAEKGIVRKL